MQVRKGAGLALCAASLAGAPMVRGDGPEAPAPVQRATPDHPMRYWVARPPGWSASGSYPVLAAIPDATKQWEETLRDYARARDTLGARFVVVVPLVVTNGPADLSRIRPAYPYDDAIWDRVRREGRCAFDLEGLEAVFRDVAARDRGVAGVFMAGVEAAGHTLFAVAVSLAPERLPSRRAAPAAVESWFASLPTTAPGRP